MNAGHSCFDSSSARKIADSPSPATSTSKVLRSTSNAAVARPMTRSFCSSFTAAFTRVTWGPPSIVIADAFTDLIASATFTAAGICGVVAVMPYCTAADCDTCSRTTSS